MAHYADKLALTGDEFFAFVEILGEIDTAYRVESQSKSTPTGGK